MFFKRLSIIISITLLIFASGVITSSALYAKNPDVINKEIVEDLRVIDNEMSLLIKSISSININKNNLPNQIKYINTLINSLNKKASMLSKEEKDVSIAVGSVLSFYQLSLISAEDYLKDFNSEYLVDSISYFSISYYALDSIRDTIIYKAAK